MHEFNRYFLSSGGLWDGFGAIFGYFQIQNALAQRPDGVQQQAAVQNLVIRICSFHF